MTGILGSSERRAVIRKLREYMDGPNAGTCPVCCINSEQMVEQHKREVERLRGALQLVAGQENTTVFHDGGDSTLVLDAEGKMRRVAREALGNG